MQLLRKAIRGEVDVLRPRSWIRIGADAPRVRQFVSGADGLMSVARGSGAALDVLARGA